VTSTLATAACCCALVSVAGCGASTSPTSTTATASGSAATAPTHGATATAPGAPATSPGASNTSAGPTTSTRAASTSATRGGGTARGGSNAPLTRYYGTIATFGSEASGSDRTAILAALHNYLSAIAAGDWAAACAQLSAPIEHQLDLLAAHAKGVRGHACSAALGALLGHTLVSARRQQAQLNILAVRASGNRAFVLYRSPQLQHAVISMFRQAGQWKAGVLAASIG